VHPTAGDKDALLPRVLLILSPNCISWADHHQTFDRDFRMHTRCKSEVYGRGVCAFLQSKFTLSRSPPSYQWLWCYASSTLPLFFQRRKNRSLSQLQRYKFLTALLLSLHFCFSFRLFLSLVLFPSHYKQIVSLLAFPLRA
jgi:hypothetical protein